MYAIANVIYGIPVEVDFDDYYSEEEDNLEDGEIFERDLENAFEENTEGFLSYYSGSSSITPMAFGVQLSRFDQCETIQVSDLVLKANKEVITQYNKIFFELPEKLKKELENFNGPTVFIMWSTS